MNETRPDFQRTKCACGTCTMCCRVQPGFLLPSDIDRVAEALGTDRDGVKEYLWASPGAVGMNTQTGDVVRIGTITPKMAHGSCIFLTKQGLCSIHAASPFGCAFFDMHMPVKEGNKRSLWGLTLINDDEEYAEYRKTLVPAKSWRPFGRSRV